MRSIDPINNELHWRLYEWGRLELLNEVESGFPLLCRIKNPAAACAHNLLSNARLSEREWMVSAFAKSFWAPFLASWGESVSEEELEFRREFSNSLMDYPAPNIDRDSSLVRRALRSECVNLMGKIFPNKSEKWGGGVSVWRAWYEDMEILTFLDFGGRTRDFSCSHGIHFEGQTIGPRISALSWMCITSSNDWKYIREDEIDTTIEVLGVCLERFTNAAPKLLRGLSTENPSSHK